MTEYVNIGGKQRPLRFGFAGLMEYEKRTARNALSDFNGQKELSVTMMVDLVFCGVVSGYMSQKMAVDFDENDVAEWLTDDPSVFASIMDLMERSSNNMGNAKAGPAKKATAAPLQRIGKR